MIYIVFCIYRCQIKQCARYKRVLCVTVFNSCVFENSYITYNLKLADCF